MNCQLSPTWQLELLDRPAAPQVMFILVNLPQPATVLCMRLATLFPVTMRAVRRKSAIRTGKSHLFPLLVVQADRTRSQRLDLSCLGSERRYRRCPERVEEVVGAEQWSRRWSLACRTSLVRFEQSEEGTALLWLCDGRLRDDPSG
jgi:hypothetical protein